MIKVRHRVLFTFLLFLALTAGFLVAENVNRTKIGVEGSAEYVNDLKVYFSKYYTLVPVEKEDVKLFLKLKKESQLGIREAAQQSKLPNVDFLVIAEGKSIRFYDMLKGTMKFNNVFSGDTALFDAVKYFENYVLYFKLPIFEDKKAYKGKVYVVLDKDMNPIGYYQHRTSSTKISIPEGTYARYLRPAVIYNGKVIYEKQEKDLSLTVYMDEYKIFEEGEIVRVPIHVEAGGYISVIDIYEDEIILVQSEPVEPGIWSFEFEAYKGEKECIETLVFVVTDEKLKKPPANFIELKEILESAKGVDIIHFVVR